MDPLTAGLTMFVSVALPIMSAVFLASYVQNKRLDDIITRLDRIEAKLEDHGTRITRVEERAPLIRR